MCRHTDAITFAAHRAEVADNNDLIAALVDTPEAYDALLIVIQRNPLETGPVVVNLPQFGMIEIEFIELTVEVFELAVHRIFEQVPVELLLIVPLVELTEFRTHKAELLAGVRHDIRHKRTQTRKLHIVVAGHLLEHGSLAVHHFIVGERQYEMLREGVHQ